MTPAAADASIKSDLADAEKGDFEAVQSVHASLAEYLRAGKLTPYMIDLLAGMHESVAKGSPAELAMLTKPVSGRPPDLSRNARIHAFIAYRVAAYTYLEQNVDQVPEGLPAKKTMKVLCEEAAAQFGVTPRIAEDAYRRIDKQIRAVTD